MFIRGSYLDGKTSKCHKVRFLVVNKSEPIRFVKDEQSQLGFDSIDSEMRFSLPFSQFKISVPLGNTPRELSFGDNELFITEDDKGITQLIGIFSGDKSVSIWHKLLLTSCPNL